MIYRSWLAKISYFSDHGLFFNYHNSNTFKCNRLIVNSQLNILQNIQQSITDSYMLKSRSKYPPGGWRFREPAMNWILPSGLGFKQAVEAITNKRKQNPRFKLPTDSVTVEAELDSFTCALLKNDPYYCDGPEATSFPKPLPVKQQPVGGRESAVGGGISFLQNVNVGIKVWRDWFGSGKPAEKSLAEKRAAVCSKCEFNVKGNFFERFSAAAGKELLAILNTLNDLDLHTSLDSELNVCEICDCALRAKVWCPLDVFAPHMSKETLDALPSWCWIVGETSQTQAS